VFCTHCGSRLPDEAAFCPMCGRQANRGPSCPNCTYRLPVGAVFCARCGRAVALPPTPAPNPGPDARASGSGGEALASPEAPAIGETEVAAGDPISPGAAAPSPAVHAPPLVSPPATAERVLPSNEASWAASETAPRRHAPSSSSVGTGYGPGTEQHLPLRPAWSSAPPPAGAPLQDTIEPTVWGVYGHAWATVRKRFFGLFAVGLVATIMSVLITGAINEVGAVVASSTGLFYLSAVAVLLSQLFGVSPIWAGVQFANLQTVRSGRAEISDIFAVYRRGLMNLIVAQVVTAVLVGVAFIVLVIPGIVVALRLSFVILLIVDEGRGPIEAIAESWRRTSGYGWTLFGIAVLTWPVLAVGLLALAVGVIPAAMVIALTGPTMFAAVTEVNGRRADTD